jgi:biopolymer transport protein ExbD
MRALARTDRKRPLISLTPLIDVVFILLVFFMLASSFTEWRAIDLATANRTTATPSTDAALLLQVQADGAVDVSGEPLSPDALTARLEVLARADADRRVAVRPAPGVPLQRVVTVMEAASNAGFTSVSLVGTAGD